MTQTTQRSLLNQNTPLEAPDVNTPDQGENPSEQPVHNWEKRYKDLQSFNSRKINDLTRQIEALQVQGTPKVQAPRTPEEMEAFKAANPEMYLVIQHMATDIAQNQMKGYDQTMGAMQNDLLDTKMERAELAIKAAHPDFEQIVESPQFAAWADRQSATVQDWIYNNPDNPELAIQALSLYKYESGQTTQTLDTSSGADIDVNQGSNGIVETNSMNHPARIWKASEIRSMSPADFAKWDETIKLAQQENRIDHHN